MMSDITAIQNTKNCLMLMSRFITDKNIDPDIKTQLSDLITNLNAKKLDEIINQCRTENKCSNTMLYIMEILSDNLKQTIQH